MSGPKLTAEQVEQLVAWREEGRSYGWIASRLGITNGGVHYQCLKHGAISPRQRGRSTVGGPAVFTASDGRVQRRFTPEEDRQLIALELEGLGYAEIATRLGRPRTSVRIRLMTLAQHEEIAA